MIIFFATLGSKTESCVDWFDQKHNNPISDSHTDHWTLVNEKSPMTVIKKMYFLDIVDSRVSVHRCFLIISAQHNT